MTTALMGMMIGDALAAGERVPTTRLRYSAGIAGFGGDLSDDRAQVVQEVDVSFLHREALNGRILGYAGVDTLWTSATHTGAFRPFPGGCRVLDLHGPSRCGMGLVAEAGGVAGQLSLTPRPP